VADWAADEPFGDSRAYLVCGDRSLQIGNDHSWVADPVRAGQLTTDEALGHPKRHYITRFVGGAPDLLVDTAEVAMSVSDRLLVCTDGLTNLVTDVELLECIKSFGQPTVAVERLVALANQRGGDDDVTVVVAHVVDSSADSTSTVPATESSDRRPPRLGPMSSLAIGGLAILLLLGMWSAATNKSLWSIAGNLARVLISRGIP
jgi:serine/threonine protein phosphatase PrpC